VEPALVEHPLDLFGRDQRTSSIVNSDVFRISFQMIQPGPNRILTVFPARDNRPNLFEIFIAEDRFDLIEPIFVRNDNDPCDATGALKCTYGMGDDRFAGDWRRQFVEAHAATVTGCNENGG
jgi:hypothetical protein